MTTETDKKIAELEATLAEMKATQNAIDTLGDDLRVLFDVGV